MNIQVDAFSDESIENAIRQLEIIAGALLMGAAMGVENAADDAAESARALYSGYESTGNGPIDVTVTETQFDESTVACNIEAHGKGIGFVEFGAGDDAMVDNPFEHEVTPIGPGTWSSSEEGSNIYSDTGRWFYNGVRYQGITPAQGMANAKWQIESEVGERIAEAFSELVARGVI